MLWVLDIHPGSSLQAAAPGMTPSPWSYEYLLQEPSKEAAPSPGSELWGGLSADNGMGVGGEGTWGWHTLSPLQLVRFLYLLAVLAGEGEVECLKYLG